MIDISLTKKIILALKYPRTARQLLIDRWFYPNRPALYPGLINVFMTEKCNYNCQMCHLKESRQRVNQELPFEDFCRIADESSKHAPAFQLTGGEPFLYSRLEEAVYYLTQKRLVKGIVTNGFLLEEKAEELVENGLDFLAVSLDGPDEKTQYKRGKVRGGFAKIVSGISKVIKIRGKRAFPNIRIATVISKNNLYNFEKIFSLAVDLQVDQWSLGHYFYYPKEIKTRQEIFAKKFKMGKDVWGEPLNKGSELFTCEQREMIKNKYKKIIAYRQSEKCKVRISFQPDIDIDKYYLGCYPSGNSVCTSPNNQIFIRGNGNIEMCQGYILGNINKDNIKNIWHNEKAKHFRKVFSKVGVMPACFRCCALNIKFD